MRTFRKTLPSVVAAQSKDSDLHKLAVTVKYIEDYLEDVQNSIKALSENTVPISTRPPIDGTDMISALYGGGGSLITGTTEAFGVGDILITTNVDNPATWLGYGTWEVFGTGRVLVGYDATNPNLIPVERTGGSW